MKFSTLVTVVAIGGVLLAGCSKPADQTSSSSTDTSAAAASAAPAATTAAATTAAATTQVAASGDVAHGEQVFSANCASCHGAKGAGGGVGPSLKGEKSRKDDSAAIAWIKNPAPPMPKLFPAPLSEKDVDDVAAYVESL